MQQFSNLDKLNTKNEALGPVITKKWFSRSVVVTRPQILDIWGQNQTFSNQENLYIKMKLLVTKLEDKKENWSTNCLERSERLRRQICQSIASIEARD